MTRMLDLESTMVPLSSAEEFKNIWTFGPPISHKCSESRATDWQLRIGPRFESNITARWCRPRSHAPMETNHLDNTH